jgi:hypothetical protein
MLDIREIQSYITKRNIFLLAILFGIFSCNRPKSIIENAIVYNISDSLYYFRTYIYNSGFDSLYLISINGLIANYDVTYYSKSIEIKPVSRSIEEYDLKIIINHSSDTFYSPIPYKKLDEFDSLKVLIPIYLYKNMFKYYIQDKIILDSSVFYHKEFVSPKIINKKFTSWFSRYM